MFKTTKNVVLAIEQPEKKSIGIKDVVDVNKGDNPKIDSRPETQKVAFDKGKSFNSRSKSNNKLNFNSSGKNRVWRIEKPFRLNIPLENVV